MAASSIQGTGAQNLFSAIRNGRRDVSGTAFGPNCSSRRRASSFVRPVSAFACGSARESTTGADVMWGSFPVDGVERNASVPDFVATVCTVTILPLAYSPVGEYVSPSISASVLVLSPLGTLRECDRDPPRAAGTA